MSTTTKTLVFISTFVGLIVHTIGGSPYEPDHQPAAPYKTGTVQSNDLYAKESEYGHDGYKDEKYPHQPYGFGYNVEDGYGNKHWRHEKSANPHQVSGSYGYLDKNGVMREVEYVADKDGFRAMIKTTEPGTAPKDPAYVKVHSQPIHVEYKPKKYGKDEEHHYEPAPAPVKHYGKETSSHYTNTKESGHYGNAHQPIYHQETIPNIAVDTGSKKDQSNVHSTMQLSYQPVTVDDAYTNNQHGKVAMAKYQD